MRYIKGQKGIFEKEILRLIGSEQILFYRELLESNQSKLTKTHSKNYYLIIVTLATLLSILFSIQFLDSLVALKVMEILRSNHVLHTSTSNIPDILPYIVYIGTAIMWFDFLYLSHSKRRDDQRRFLQLAALAVPIAYILKTYLQYAFGRTNTRLWLTTHTELKFNWFHGAGIGCFPSGHMTVFTAFGVAVWYIYPRYRRITVLGLSLLGAALIATDYHFLSDVIAGAYIGMLVTYIIQATLKKFGLNLWITNNYKL